MEDRRNDGEGKVTYPEMCAWYVDAKALDSVRLRGRGDDNG